MGPLHHEPLGRQAFSHSSQDVDASTLRRMSGYSETLVVWQRSLGEAAQSGWGLGAALMVPVHVSGCF